MAVRAPRIFISAGEPSGDQHAARVAEALRRRWPEAIIDAFGGPALRAAGATVRFRMEAYTVIGFFEVLAKLPAHVRLYRQVVRDFRAGRYDLLICVDYPGFNIRLAEAARRVGVRSLYYVAPQLWAWRPERARRFAGATDRVAVILPFEPEFFGRVGVKAEFVGHPLVEHSPPERMAARSALGLSQTERVLAVFPGSRTQEIARLWPVFRDAATRLLKQGACDRVVVAGTAGRDYQDQDQMMVHQGQGSTVLAAADAALVKSGTTTLEAAVADTPMVVAYRVHPITAAIARRLMTVPWISLVNLVAGRQVVPEVVQNGVTADALAELVRPLLASGSAAACAQHQALAEVRARLGTPGAAMRVAVMAEELLAA
jgi:lipid-A-disaccharide synthase